MSQIHTRSPKHCAQRGFFHLHKKLLYTSSTIFLSILSFILLLWLFLHPTKPHFTLLQAQIYQLNLSSNPNYHLLSSSLQLTLESRNPNTKVGVYYDHLVAYASYKGQPISARASLPPFFQGQQESYVFSMSLGASSLPVAPLFGFDIARDEVAGRMVVVFKVDGRLRWKVGSWVSGGHRIDVDCTAVLPFGVTVAPVSSAGEGTHCATSV